MTTPPEVEPVAPEDARQALDEALAPYLADGWTVLVAHDFMARITRGQQNLDFHVDLLGDVRIEEHDLSPVQDAGRLVAWLLLLVSFLLAIAIASAVGWI